MHSGSHSFLEPSVQTAETGLCHFCYLKLIAHKTWNVIQRKFFIFHFNKIGKIKGIYRGHKITHNTCSMQCSMGTGLLRQGKCLNFLWLLSVNTHFPDEHSKYSLFLFSREGGWGGGGNLSLQLPCRPEYTRPQWHNSKEFR